MIPFLAIHAKGGESMSPKQKDRTTHHQFQKLRVSKEYYHLVSHCVQKGERVVFQKWYIKTLLNTKRRISFRGSFVFANYFVNPFQSSFANSQRQMNKILQSIFKIWNFLPLFQMLILWLNKTPPKWDPPLSVQEGFDISFLKYYSLPLLNTIGYQLINTLGKHEVFEIGGGAVLLLWALTFSPFGMNRQKRNH